MHELYTVHVNLHIATQFQTCITVKLEIIFCGQRNRSPTQTSLLYRRPMHENFL